MKFITSTIILLLLCTALLLEFQPNVVDAQQCLGVQTKKKGAFDYVKTDWSFILFHYKESGMTYASPLEYKTLNTNIDKKNIANLFNRYISDDFSGTIYWFNDQKDMSKKKYITTSTPHGHAKYLIRWDPDEEKGFFVQHTFPAIPEALEGGTLTDVSEHVLCISLESEDEYKKIADLLKVVRPRSVGGTEIGEDDDILSNAVTEQVVDSSAYKAKWKSIVEGIVKPEDSKFEITRKLMDPSTPMDYSEPAMYTSKSISVGDEPDDDDDDTDYGARTFTFYAFPVRVSPEEDGTSKKRKTDAPAATPYTAVGNEWGAFKALKSWIIQDQTPDEDENSGVAKLDTVAEFGLDAWYALASRILKKPMYVVSWLSSPDAFSSCVKNNFYLINFHFCDNGGKLNKHSHEKIGYTGGDDNIVCFGDSNRHKSQNAHPGMMICVEDAGIKALIVARERQVMTENPLSLDGTDIKSHIEKGVKEIPHAKKGDSLSSYFFMGTQADSAMLTRVSKIPIVSLVKTADTVVVTKKKKATSTNTYASFLPSSLQKPQYLRVLQNWQCPVCEQTEMLKKNGQDDHKTSFNVKCTSCNSQMTMYYDTDEKPNPFSEQYKALHDKDLSKTKREKWRKSNQSKLNPMSAAATDAKIKTSKDEKSDDEEDDDFEYIDSD